MKDNYDYWDENIIVGSVRTFSYLEFVYLLRRTSYTGWGSIDKYPHREDRKEAVNESILWIVALSRVVDSMNLKKVDMVI